MLTKHGPVDYGHTLYYTVLQLSKLGTKQDCKNA